VVERALIAAVLGPHDGKDPEFGEIGFAAKRLDDPVVLVALEPVAFEEAGIDVTRHDDDARSRKTSPTTASAAAARPSARVMY
jgi:hypothetical protein